MFWNRKKSPVTPDDEEWLVSSFHWFEETFNINLREQEIISPTIDSIGFKYQGNEDDVLTLVDFVADKMRFKKLVKSNPGILIIVDLNLKLA